jgi:protein tyrosine phosphatase
MLIALIQSIAMLGSLSSAHPQKPTLTLSYQNSSKLECKKQVHSAPNKKRNRTSAKKPQYAKKGQFVLQKKTKKRISKDLASSDEQKKNELEGVVLIPDTSVVSPIPPIPNDNKEEAPEEVVYGRFPKETLKLSDLKRRSEELKANNWKEAERLMRQIRKQFERHLEQQDRKGARHNFDANLSCIQMQNRHETDPIINASDVQMGGCNYLLFGCPWRASHATVLFDVALQQGVTLFVSTLESTDAQDKFNNFWKNDKLALLRSRDGWTITNIGYRVLAVGEMEPEGNKEPQIIESTLLATRAGETRTLTHLHYEGWRDRQAMPSEALFHIFQDRIAELQKGKTTPFAINCHGGVGRTGTTALSHYFRQEVDAQLAAGKKLDDIEVNIPEVLFKFRLQRKWFLGESGQLANAYSVLGDYYEKLKRKMEIIEDEPSSLNKDDVVFYTNETDGALSDLAVAAIL